MASVIDMLNPESLRALERLGRSPASKPPKTIVHNGRTLPKQEQGKLPYPLNAIKATGYNTIFLEPGIVGMIEAHWTREELAIIARAVETGNYTKRKTWKGGWGVVVQC